MSESNTYNNVAHSRENSILFFTNYVKHNGEHVHGKTIYDLSSGTGYIGNLFYEAGALVRSFDLLPTHTIYSHLACEKIDVQRNFSKDLEKADLIILSETIEHLPNAFLFFSEAALILKNGGKLLLTTPNVSSLRSRFSYFVLENEHYSQPTLNETNAYVYWEESSDRYFSKLFLRGILHIRTLAAIHGLRIRKMYKSSYSSSSIFLLFLYPIIYFFSFRMYRRQVKKSPQHKSIYKEMFKLNTDISILLSKHLNIEFEKIHF